MQNLWKQVADQYCTSAEDVQLESGAEASSPLTGFLQD